MAQSIPVRVCDCVILIFPIISIMATESHNIMHDDMTFQYNLILSVGSENVSWLTLVS